MAFVARKQQTTALFLSTVATRTRTVKQNGQKTDKPNGKPLLCQRTLSSISYAVFNTVKLYSLTKNMRGPLDLMTPKYAVNTTDYYISHM